MHPFARRIADAIAVLVTVVWILAESFLLNLFGKRPILLTNGDYSLIYRYSRQIVETHRYPPQPYPYPPAGIVLQYFTALFPFPVSAALWLGLMTVAALGCWWILIRMLGLGKIPGALALIPFAYAFSDYFFHWDLTRQNSNVIFLGATLMGVLYLQRRRPVPAGFWISLGISIKLFSFLLVPYLFWKRRFREFGWTLAFLATFWLLLPVAVFGIGGSADVYHGWFEQLRDAAQFSVNQPHPILISLARSGAALFPGEPHKARLLVGSFGAAWFALLVIACVLPKNRRQTSDAFALLSDVGLMILAPMAVSAYLEPYHPVAAICLGAAFLALAAPSGWDVRGLTVNLRLLLAVGGTVAIASLRNRYGAPKTGVAASAAAGGIPVRSAN